MERGGGLGPRITPGYWGLGIAGKSGCRYLERGWESLRKADEIVGRVVFVETSSYIGSQSRKARKRNEDKTLSRSTLLSQPSIAPLRMPLTRHACKV
jgi:hypothetical protein